MPTVTVALDTPRPARTGLSEPIRAGTRDNAPVLAGIVPFGLVVGVAMAGAGFGLADGLAATLIVYGGTAQLAALAALGSGAAPVMAVLTALVVNARLLVYSAGLAERLRCQPRWFKLAGPFLLVDHVFALVDGQPERGSGWVRRYWLTLGAWTTGAWLVAVATGMVVGDALPRGAPLQVVMPAAYLAMLLPRTRSHPGLVAAVVGALVAVAASGLGHGLGVLAGAVAGVLAAATVPAPGDGPAPDHAPTDRTTPVPARERSQP